MATGSGDLLTTLLKDVSRSFYLSLRVLPRGVRRQIGLAYLLARASDTIADTDAIAASERLAALDRFRAAVQRPDPEPILLEALAGYQTTAGERLLLQRLPEALSCLSSFNSSDQAVIRKVLDTIISGQALDLERFANAHSKGILALNSDEDLNDYTYRVAGCVGEFWTRICRAHLFPRARLDDAELLRNGVRFGKGLQLVNILRDIPRDLRLGRCYLPAPRLRACALAPLDLLNPANEPALRPLYNEYLDLAEDHLRAGWAYTNTIPFGQVRVRLACAWPILIGLETLRLLHERNVLDPAHRIKVSRNAVRGFMARTLLFYPWTSRWRQLADLKASSGRNPLPLQASLAK